MKKDYIHKQFWNYVLPSMFTMLLSGFYAIVDGLFVGNAVGDTALGGYQPRLSDTGNIKCYSNRTGYRRLCCDVTQPR